jgi:hypothetical protein
MKDLTLKIQQTIAGLVDYGAHQSPESIASQVVKKLGLKDRFVNYAHIEIRNRLTEPSFKRVPFNERILFLPHCLRNSSKCKAHYTDEGLQCKACGACQLSELIALGKKFGYRRIFITPGGSMVAKLAKKYLPKAVVGIACNDEINMGLNKMRSFGIPAQAVLLLRDGCKDTAVNIEEALEKISLIEESVQKS